MQHKSIVHSVTRNAKIPRNLSKLFAERRTVAQGMIDEADGILSELRYHNQHAIREARTQKQQGIKLLSMSA